MHEVSDCGHVSTMTGTLCHRACVHRHKSAPQHDSIATCPQCCWGCDTLQMVCFRDLQSSVWTTLFSFGLPMKLVWFLQSSVWTTLFSFGLPMKLVWFTVLASVVKFRKDCSQRRRSPVYNFNSASSRVEDLLDLKFFGSRWRPQPRPQLRSHRMHRRAVAAQLPGVLGQF